MSAHAPYLPLRPGASRFMEVRGLRHHVQVWGDPAAATPARPLLVMLHGWMDVGASFQFAVDALSALEGESRCVVAPDWRGFGQTEAPPRADSYWHPDYLGDLDGLLDTLSPGTPVDLLGHSMGGNIAMVYAGVRPARIRRLVNLEGFGMPVTHPAQAPGRYARWLDELKTPMPLKPYASLDAVALRLRKNNPLLRPDRADWLAAAWARPDAQGQWHLLADPAHKRTNPVLHQVDETLACWQAIEAPVLWAEGDRSDLDAWFGGLYTKAQFHARLQKNVRRFETHVFSPAGHMLHHDQPEALAQRVKAFLDAP